MRTPTRSSASSLVALLAAILVVSSLLHCSTARAERLGPGHPSPPSFSGYTTRAGHELGIARVGRGPFGICLDTGTRRWPDRVGHTSAVTQPVVGYLLSVHLDEARHDGVLAAALWWVVGRLQGLNAQPARMAARMAELRRESPNVLRRVVARARALLEEARRLAPSARGYVAPRPVLSTDGLTGTVADLGLRSAGGRWVPGIGIDVSLRGARFDDGRTTHSFRSGDSPGMLGWQRDGASAVSVRVRYTGVPAHRYVLLSAGSSVQRIATAARPRTLTTAASTPALSTPHLVTKVNRQHALVGDLLVDDVSITGSGGSHLEGEWVLLGPVAPDRGGRCRAARWAGAPVAARGVFLSVGDGSVQVGRTRVRTGGCYTYRERLIPSATSTGAEWTAPGLVEETSLVTPRQTPVPAHPHVDTGGRGSGPRTAPARGRARVVVPSAGVGATLDTVAFRGSTLTAPRARSSAGVWNGSVPLSSLVGTTLAVGHVSDAHDRPGAFHGLRRVRTGQRITTVDPSGAVRQWRVTKVWSADRRRLPRAPFTQSVVRRLVLITCTQRVVTPGGGFHYRRILVVEAAPW